VHILPQKAGLAATDKVVFHIICQQTKQEGGLQWHHWADDIAAQRLTAFSSRMYMKRTATTHSYTN